MSSSKKHPASYIYICIHPFQEDYIPEPPSKSFSCSSEMNKQSCDSLIVHSSSIALLQERFRQLQRAKEMREGRELLRQETEPDRDNSSACQDPSRVPFQSELIRPLRLPLQGSPSSSSSYQKSQSKQADLWAAATPPTSASLRYMETVKHRSPSSFQESDIDTSLHL